MAHGSAFPFVKLVLNDSVPPILMASLRMGLVLLILIPFWKFKIPEKKYMPSLIAFSISMGVMVYVFMTLALYYSSIISPVIVGSQLAIPFGILASAFMLNENISPKKWFFIFSAFIGVLIIFFDPKLVDNFLGLLFAVFWDPILSKIGILSFVDTIGSFFGPIAGIMLVDYYVIKDKKIINKDIFSSNKEGAYFYSGGWQIKSIYSLFIGFIFASATIWNIELRFLQSFSWIIGAFVSSMTYYLLASK